MMLDTAAFIGPYPYRALPACGVDHLLAAMDSGGIDQAWVGHLPSFLYRDPAPGTRGLLAALAPHRDRLRPVPAVHPGMPRWEGDLEQAVHAGAPAVRVYPTWQGLDPAGGEMRVLAAAAAAVGLPLLLTVRFEDARQRHPLDAAAELPAAAVRRLVRADPAVRLLVSHAERSFIEEVHFGLTPAEAARILWDIAWIWGPPEDHLALLLETLGVERFCIGTGFPLRLVQGPGAKLDLLALPAAAREAIASGNVAAWAHGGAPRRA